MKRLFGCLLLAALPALAPAGDVQVNVGSIRVETGGTTISFGERDRRGYYWDGRVWRDPVYWEKHHGKGQGHGNGYHCPPGQAKKGNCPPHQVTPYR